jgi:cytochrome b561
MMTRPARTSRAHDTHQGYGWVSIVLHWLAAAIIVTLWFIGSSVSTAGTHAHEVLALHTSIALSAYPLLWGRLLWRWRCGHPGPAPAQRGWSFTLARIAHGCLLVVIAILLISGPLTAWLRGDALQIWSVAIPTPLTATGAAQLAHQCHSIGANILLLGILLHIGGAMKHMAINRDGTLERMLIAQQTADHSDASAEG